MLATHRRTARIVSSLLLRGTKPSRRQKSDSKLQNTFRDLPAVFQKMTAQEARKKTALIALTEQERYQLEIWARSRTSSHRLVVRSRILLLASSQLSAVEIAARLHVARGTVQLWMKRFNSGGVAAILRDAPGRGRRKGTSGRCDLAVLRATHDALGVGERPTVRRIAKRVGVSAATVWRVWGRCAIDTRGDVRTMLGRVRQLISETHGGSE